jgi:alpha-L-fucosidase
MSSARAQRWWIEGIIVGLLFVAATVVAAEDKPLPSTGENAGPPANAERLAWWRDARFGMFIHWGPVSLKGTEIGWSRGAEVPLEEYDNLYKQFNPEKFDARAWVRLAKQAGMKYLIFTTKHHDGFCMFDTQETDFNIMHSPLGRDVVKELAEACRQEGIAFGTYHSVCDWHHPDFPHGSPGGQSLKPHPNLDGYEQYLRRQVRELITQYGPLLILWFDVAQDFDAERGQGVVDYVRSLQQDIIINNRCAVPGDYDTPEQQIGGFNRERPWETCMTIAQQWAWKPQDATKSRVQCLQTLLRVVGGDGNLLFNVGPMPDGRIEPEQVERLQEMGAWLSQYGAGVYGTRGGPFKPGPWGASTCQGNVIHLFVMKWPEEGPLQLPPLPCKIVASQLLTGGSMQCDQTDEGLLITVPPSDRPDVAAVIRLQLDSEAFEIPPIHVAWSHSLAHEAPATASNVFQNMVDTYGPAKALDDNADSRWATDAGTRQASLEVDLRQPKTISRMVIDEAYAGRIRKFELQVKVEDAWQTIFAGETVGREWTCNFPPVTTRYIRLNILDATEGPTIWEFQVF